jgi:hypothetical protein
MGELTSARTAVADVSHHMFYLADPDTYPQPPLAPVSNGLVVCQPSIAIVFVGTATGPVNVTVEPRSGPPAGEHVAEWDEVVEVSIWSAAGQLQVTNPMAYPPPSLPILTTTGPGHYRLRVHARGRDRAPDLVAYSPHEDYLLVSWPAPDAPEVIHKQTDHYGATWRSTSPPAPPGHRPDPDKQRRDALDDNLRHS